MATYTDKFNLKLPAGNELVSRQDLNANFQSIDDNSVSPVNAEISNSLTIGTRESGSTVGDQSVSVGSSCEASGNKSIACGLEAEASGTRAISLSTYGKSTGLGSVSIGYSTKAEGQYSFAAGLGSRAIGSGSFAFGYNAIAKGKNSVAYGDMNKDTDIDDLTNVESWVSGKHYYLYDVVKYNSTRYMCRKENSDTSFNAQNWAEGYGDFVETVGNGSTAVGYERSNARALDWRGNERLMGTLICECNIDSTGGKRLIFNQDGTVTWEAVT